MADFKQIKVGNTTYDVKDETARNAISSMTSATLPYSTDPAEGSTKDKIDSKLDKTAITTESKNGAETTVTASGIANIDIDITKSGYTPIAIAGVLSGQYLVPYRFSITSSSNCNLRLKNITTASQTTTPSVIILYIKN